MQTQPKATVEAIEQWLVTHLAGALNLPASEIVVDTPFDRYGVDSLIAVTMTGDLEEWLGIEIPVTLAWDYPNIQLLAAYLAELAANPPSNP